MGKKNHCVSLNNRKKSISKSRALRNISYKGNRKDLFSGPKGAEKRELGS